MEKKVSFNIVYIWTKIN